MPYVVYRETTSLLVALYRLHRLPRPKRKDLSHRLRANKRLLLPQLATDPGKRFSQIGFQTIRVAERGIEDRLHLLSTALRVTGRGCKESFEVFVALLPGHEFSNRHLTLRLVMNMPGRPKLLPAPIATLDSCRMSYDTAQTVIASGTVQSRFAVDFSR